jgi:hypothetical protein
MGRLLMPDNSWWIFLTIVFSVSLIPLALWIWAIYSSIHPSSKELAEHERRIAFERWLKE